MKKNPHLVAGVHRFEESNTPPIGCGGIVVDGIAPCLTAVILYKMHYLSTGSPCLLKIDLAKDFSVHTIFGTPFQRKSKLTYMPHLGLVVSNIWGISFPFLFKKSEPIECSPVQGPVIVLPFTPFK
jgi:hypothetical protein